MVTPSQLAAALLQKQQESSAVTDLLWERAGNGLTLTPTAAPTNPEFALKLVKGSAEAALAVSEALTDPVALDLVARKDTRRRTRRAVAANKNTSRETLLYLLSWAVRPAVKDADTIRIILNRGDGTLSWDEHFAIFHKLENPLGTFEEFPVLSLVVKVRSEGTSKVYLQAFSLQVAEISHSLLRDVFAGKVEGLTFTEALDAATSLGGNNTCEETRRSLLGCFLVDSSKEITAELAKLIVAEFPAWGELSFPYRAFSQGRRDRSITLEAVDLFETANHWALDWVLAACEDVPDKVRLRLVKEHTLAMTMAHLPDLSDVMFEAIVEAPVLVASSMGTYRETALAPLVGRKDLPPRFATRLLERIVAENIPVNQTNMHVTLNLASREARLNYLRAKGSWDFTLRHILNYDEVSPVEEFKELLADPGIAFKFIQSTGTYSSQHVVATEKEVIAPLIFSADLLRRKSWAFEMFDLFPGVLSSSQATHVLTGYIWDRFKPIREDAALLGAALTLAPEWTGTLPELVDVVLLTA